MCVDVKGMFVCVGNGMVAYLRHLVLRAFILK